MKQRLQIRHKVYIDWAWRRKQLRRLLAKKIVYFLFDPVPVLRIILRGVSVENQGANIVKAINVFEQIRHIVCNLLDARIHFSQFVLEHLYNRVDWECNIREVKKGSWLVGRVCLKENNCMRSLCHNGIQWSIQESSSAQFWITAGQRYIPLYVGRPDINEWLIRRGPVNFLRLHSYKMGKGKPSGIRAGRKLKVHRRNERWSSKKYNKSHSVSHMKANPLGGSCMSKGIVLEKM